MSKRLKPEREWLVDRYVTQDLSVETIMKEIGAAECTIYAWLRSYDIPTKKDTVEYCLKRYGDKTGKRVGRLTVLRMDVEPHLERRGRFWICQCDCGNILSVSSCGLGNQKSCGCLLSQPHKKLEGKRFGRLFVMREHHQTEKQQRHYECQCDCGAIKVIDGASLRRGNTRSCGCLTVDRLKKNCGPKHYLWKHDISKEEREEGKERNLNPKVIQWRNAVYERDNYVCQISGQKGGFMNAHHIISWSSSKELRFEINNGVTIERKLHTLFHRTYGYRNNTREQLEEFRTRFRNGEFQ